MREIFSSMLINIRSLFMGVWTKLRYWTSVTYWRTQGLARLRSFFQKLFDVKPKHKDDYYPLARWLVSKKLAFAIVVALGIAATYYILIMSPLALAGGAASGTAVRTYKYDSLPLKFVSGRVRIMAADRYIAYVGDVEGGSVTGEGSLYDAEGAVVYEGQFAQNMFEGQGRLYYPDGVLRYEGAFSKNLYNGTGKSYRPDGSLLHEGGYLDGLKSGAGRLFGVTGEPVYSGTFLFDHLIYRELVGKTTPEAAENYVGRQTVYMTGAGEYCAQLTDINAVYTARTGSGSLDGEWTIENIIVLSNAIPFSGSVFTTINELTAYLGQPEYMGSTWVTLSEAAALNLLPDPAVLGQVEMRTEAVYDNVINVIRYDRNFEVFIYVYRADDLLYTFYCANGGAPGFGMYSIAAA